MFVNLLKKFKHHTDAADWVLESFQRFMKMSSKRNILERDANDDDDADVDDDDDDADVDDDDDMKE